MYMRRDTHPAADERGNELRITRKMARRARELAAGTSLSFQTPSSESRVEQAALIRGYIRGQVSQATGLLV
jgi:hypothetical protein